MAEEREPLETRDDLMPEDEPHAPGEAAPFEPLFLTLTQLGQVYAEAGGALLEARLLERRLRALLGTAAPETAEEQIQTIVDRRDYDRLKADFLKSRQPFERRE